MTIRPTIQKYTDVLFPQSVCCSFLLSLFFSLLLVIFAFISPVPARGQAPSVLSYDLGEAGIVQQQFAPDSRFYTMQVALRGILAVPEGEGPFPVALFIHGSYAFCTAEVLDVDLYPCPPEHQIRQYEGFGELAAALAARGYLTVVPDLSAEFNNGFGEPILGQRSSQIIEAHLNALSTGAGFGIDLAGRVDLSRLVIATHSRGGPLAINYLASNNALAQSASALAMLTPAYISSEPNIPATLPTAVVIAECDGDVRTEQPLLYLQEQLPPLRPALTLSYTIVGGTHNAFSTLLADDPTQPCEASRQLDAQAQRDFTAQLLPDFFDIALALRLSPHAS